MAGFLYQEVARCFGCGERVEGAALVFASLCGHETCPSTCWHYDHLMQAREAEQEARKTGGSAEKAIAHLILVLRRDNDGDEDCW